MRWLAFLIALVIAHEAWPQDLEKVNQKNPVQIHGTFGGGLSMYSIDGREANRQPFSWYLLGSPSLDVYGVQLPFYFGLSEQDRSFRQPFNQFGLSPHYKWLKVHLGYRSVRFSPYTLAGHSMLGAGIELNPGKFRFGFITGRLRRAIAIDTTISETMVQTPSFKRNGTAIKIGYGTDHNFVDLILFRGEDDGGSLDPDPLLTIKPQSNLVLGLSTRQKLGKYFEAGLDLSQSLYTKDNRLPETDTGVTGLVKLVAPLIATNASTRVSNAIEAHLAYEGDQFGMGIRYKRIDPNFRSFGAYYFQNDLENITIEPTWKSKDQKWQVEASIGRQRDNLKEDQNVQTHRTIGSIRLSGQPVTPYNFQLYYGNYDIGQKEGLTPVDTISQIAQTEHTAGMVHTYTKASTTWMHNVVLMLNFQKLVDRNSNTDSLTSFNSWIAMGNYLISYLPWQLSVTVGYSKGTFNLAGQDNSYQGPNVNVSKTFLKQKLLISAGYSRQNVTLAGQSGLQLAITNFQAGYRFLKHHQLSAKLYFRNSVNDMAGGENYKETKGDLVYGYSF